MTVIVWDGKTLAADRLVSNCGGPMHMATTKVRKHRDDRGQVLMAFAGNATAGVAMFEWYANGAIPARYPPAQHAVADETCDFYVIHEGGHISKYERHPVAIPLEAEKFTAGSGADFATGALAMGAKAVQAVLIASEYADGCGLGFDAVEFDRALQPCDRVSHMSVKC